MPTDPFIQREDGHLIQCTENVKHGNTTDFTERCSLPVMAVSLYFLDFYLNYNYNIRLCTGVQYPDIFMVSRRFPSHKEKELKAAFF
jgi:hypothetical protein